MNNFLIYINYKDINYILYKCNIICQSEGMFNS